MHKNIDFIYDIGYEYVKNKIKVVDSEIKTERIKEKR